MIHGDSHLSTERECLRHSTLPLGEASKNTSAANTLLGEVCTWMFGGGSSAIRQNDDTKTQKKLKWQKNLSKPDIFRNFAERF